MAELGFGLMRLPLRDPEDHGSVDIEALKGMVDEYMAAGMGYFDAAYYYHRSNCEDAIRQALVERYPRDSFRLATKMPLKLLQDGGDPEAIFREQLERCGVDFFDSYMIHNACSSYYPAAERLHLFEMMRRFKAEGKVRRIGISIHDNAAFLERVLDAHPYLDFVQLQVNYLDWESPTFESRRCCEVAREHGIPVIVMEPVRGGALAVVSDAVRDRMEEVRPGASPASWALRFAANAEGVETVLSGMSDLEQLRDNIGTFRTMSPLSDAEREVMAEAAKAISSGLAVPCTGCRYCVDECPRDILIPDYFKIYSEYASAPNKGLPPQRFYYLNLSQGHGRASDCIGCGRCETSCPQHIDIRQVLKDVAKSMEVF